MDVKKTIETLEKKMGLLVLPQNIDSMEERDVENVTIIF